MNFACKYWEDATDRDVYVDFRPAIERVEDQQLLAARPVVKNQIDFRCIARRHRCQMPNPDAAVEDGLVG